MRYLLLLFLLIIPTSADAVWFDSSWDYRVKVEIDPAKVAGSANLTNYPVYLNLDDLPTDFHTNVKSDGCDIRLIESNETTETAFELVAYDSGADTGELHFLADSLDYAATTTFYVYYGNAAASCYAVTDTYGRNNVWSNYTVVIHGEVSSGTVTDSTGNTLTKYKSNTPTAGSGKLGNAVSPNSAYWSSSVNPNTAIGTGDFTAQYWNNFSTNASRRTIVYMGRNGTFNDAWQGLVYESAAGNKNTFGARAGTTGDVESRGTAVDGAWRMEVFTRTGTTGSHYENGISVYSASNAEWGVQVGGATSPILTIAAGHTSGVFPVIAGALDEFRLRASLLSANWITTEYNNQSSPATFYYIGAQETEPAGGGGATSTDSGIIWFD